MKPVNVVRKGEDNNSVFIASNIGELLLDTGATSSQITEKSVPLNTKIVGDIKSHGFFGKSRTMRNSTVPILSIGDIVKQNVPMQIDMSLNAHGILGMDILSEYKVFLDIKNGIVCFDSEKICSQEMYKGNRKMYCLPIVLNGISLWGLLDTGASGTIVSKTLFKKYPEFFEYAGKDTAKDWTGAGFSCDLVTIKNLIVGDYKIPDHKGAILNLWPYRFLIGKAIEFIIGVTTLEKGNWIFDFPNSKWEYIAY